MVGLECVRGAQNYTIENTKPLFGVQSFTNPLDSKRKKRFEPRQRTKILEKKMKIILDKLRKDKFQGKLETQMLDLTSILGIS